MTPYEKLKQIADELDEWAWELNTRRLGQLSEELDKVIKELDALDNV